MSDPGSPGATFGQAGWRRFCQLVVSVFYRRCEVTGLENLPATGPLLLCGNHVNALVDGLVVQATCPRPIHPLARSGLFRMPIFRTILRLIQAVPVYRRHRGETGDEEAARDRKSRNLDSFQRCYDYLGEGRVLLIFPEGQSHSDPRLRSLKTGAARLALGNLEAHGELPAVVPVGLTFTRKGRFRAGVLVQYGEPVTFEEAEETLGEASRSEEGREAAVRQLTRQIGEGLEEVTLNSDSWEDLALMRLLQEFFTLRRTRLREVPLRERFRSFQRLIAAHRHLRFSHPQQVALLRAKLRRFEKLRRQYGVRDYQLELRYTPWVVLRYVLRVLMLALVAVPLGLWGVLNSALPYYATRLASRRTARGLDQYDTAGILFGTLFFLLFWGAQCFAVWWLAGLWPAVAYGVSLPLTTMVALAMSIERHRILENARVFFLFLRKRRIQSYLRLKREELEIEIARMARLAQRELGPDWATSSGS